MVRSTSPGAAVPDDAEVLEGPRSLAAAVLAAGGSYSEAGEAAARSKRTVLRWAGDPGFARLVADLRAERLSEVTGRLAELAPRAVAVLSDALESEKASVRLRAAHLTLEWTLRLRRAADLEVRMLEVELRQGVRSPGDIAQAGRTDAEEGVA